MTQGQTDARVENGGARPGRAEATGDMAQALRSGLAACVGEDRLLSGDAAEALYTDVYRALEIPAAVVQPETVDELQAVARCCHEHGAAISVRGGGASYTDGYLPRDAGQVLLDLSQLNRIVEINEQDAYVTVEAGVTWEALKRALDERDLRTPFWGPFSGLLATVGGSVAQNTISHGSGAHGISAQSVQSLDVVLADGSLLQTGSAAAGGGPFLRHAGPDLTGLFTGDCGALGIKARVTLPLLRRRAAHATASFAFPDFDAMHESMRRIALERLEDTHCALDGALSRGQIARQDSAGNTLKVAMSILTTSPSWLDGVKQLVRSAVSARRVISRSAYMTHYIVEGVGKAEAELRLHRIRELVMGLGREIPATVPAVIRGMPFAPFFNTLGPEGERWVPLHGILPHSRTQAFHAALEAFFGERAADMTRLGIWHGSMFATVGSSGFLYELALYWPDETSAYHRAVVPADYLEALPAYPANPEARAYVHHLKEDLIALYAAHGASHFQVGKAYPYASTLSPPSRALIDAIKRATDPGAALSPGVLGLS